MNILIVGKDGMVAQELRECFRTSGIDVVCKGRPEMDLCNPQTIRDILFHDPPSVIINAAAYTAVDQAESEPELAFTINRDGVRYLAEAAHGLGIPLIHISTDFVFDGNNRRPYREEDPKAPLGVYGQSKWEGEEVVRQCHPHHIILRTAWLYSIYGKNFLKTIVAKAMSGKELRVVNDQHGCPTWAKDLASAVAVITQMIQEGKNVLWGTYHFCGAGEVTWYEFTRAIIEQAQDTSSFKAGPIYPITTEEYPTLTKRPAYSVLDCLKIEQAFGIKPPQWRNSLQHCVKELFACPDFLHAQS